MLNGKITIRGLSTAAPLRISADDSETTAKIILPFRFDRAKTRYFENVLEKTGEITVMKNR